MHSHTVLGWSLPASSSAFGCHEGRKLLSHCSSSVTALCSGADLPQTSFNRFWSPYIKKLWQPSLSCQQVPENHQHREDLAGGGCSLLGLGEDGKVIVGPLHRRTSTQPWKGSPHEHPRAPRAHPPSRPPQSPPQTLLPLLLLPPLTSHNLAQSFVYVCVSVCALGWWLTKSPQESNLCVSAHPGCVGGRGRPRPPSRVLRAC